ncbi:MAG: GAF domain-containing sensor histidine kinase [Anaerolineales bacterium]|nr:GAF domain-containing sensor histidine kinase [Anaerolineales bacterium]
MNKLVGGYKTLNEISSVVSQSLDLNEILHSALDMVLKATCLQVGGIYLLNEQSRILSIHAQRGFSPDFASAIDHLEIGEGFSGMVVESGEPLVIRDITKDERLSRGIVKEEGLKSLLVVPLCSKSRTLGTIFLVSKEIRDFSEDEISLLITAGQQIGVAVDNASMFQAQQRRAEQFRVIGEVGRQITSIMEVDQLLNQVVHSIHKTFGYDHVAIAMIEDDYAVYRVGAGPLWENPAFNFNPSRLKIGSEGITGRVAASGAMIYLPDVREDPSYVEMQGSKTLSEITVPIKVKDKVIGVLDAQSERVNAFDDTDLVVLQSLADQTAVAIENAKLYRQAKQLAVVEERNRLARELHDSVTQALYGITLHAEAAFRQLDARNIPLANEQLEELRSTAQEALREMRLLIFELRPSVVEMQGLIPALRARLEAVEERAGMNVEINVDENLELSDRIQDGLYRIAQEALNNALKHAKANQIILNLTGTMSRVKMEIMDDGVGFKPDESVEGGGLGLDGIIERAELLNGELTLDSWPGRGTTIRIEVPYA